MKSLSLALTEKSVALAVNTLAAGLAASGQNGAMEENLIVKPEGTVTRITLNRPEKRNALSLALMQELIAALRAVDSRIVVLEGAGPCFSAGHDLAEMVPRRPLSFYQELFAVCTELMETVQGIPQPVIAKVHGIATAAGCQLVAACDLAVAEEGARFATPGVNIGLFCSTPMVEVSRALGRKRAMEMLLTGTPIDAATAAEWGLVNRVVSAESLDEAVAELAERIASASPLVVGLGKEAFYHQIDVDKRQAYDLTKAVMSMNAMTGDAQEGICAFLEKRPPTWTGE
jgi:enoyl-CoA hydratase/carnithine racemase